MTQPEPSGGLKEKALSLGLELVGVCSPFESTHVSAYETWIQNGFAGEMEYLSRHIPLKKNPELLLEGVQSVIVVGLNYNQYSVSEVSRPRVARYALGRDYHRVLHGKLGKLKQFIEERYSESHSRVCVDSAPVLERDFAQLAGLGWFGKNTMIINSARGSWFFLGVVLTTVRFALDEPSHGGCGTCVKCIEACPTGAIVYLNGRWQVDARKCISYLTIEYKGEVPPELRRKMGGWTIGCDVCQEVCPFNTPRESQPLRAQLTSEPDFAARPWPSLVELAQISEGQWDSLTQGSATRRVSADRMRRNAQINLENASLDAPNPPN